MTICYMDCNTVITWKTMTGYFKWLKNITEPKMHADMLKTCAAHGLCHARQRGSSRQHAAQNIVLHLDS